MDTRTLHVLEFPKLLAYLAGFAVSEAGSRACLGLRPSSTLEQAARQAELFEQGNLWLEFTSFSLLNFPSLDGVLAFLENDRQPLELDGLWILRQMLGHCGELLESLTRPKQARQLWPLLLELPAPLPQKSLQALFRCLNEDGFLRDEASPELALVRSEIRRIHRQCNSKAGEFIRLHNLSPYLQDEYITLASDRYVLPFKSNFKNKFPGIVHDYSQTGETCYFEPMFLVDLNNSLQEFKREEREEERKILIYISDLLRTEKNLLGEAYRLLVDMDVLQARSRLGASYAGVLVRLGADLPVNLLEARHPLLTLAGLSAENGERSAAAGYPEPEPVDIQLSAEQRTLIISGGNAGGKTVCLKTVGLVSLMALCSIPAPVARGSTLPFWKNILPFIGDDQSLEDHVSTFTAQIAQLTAYWEKLGENALVILDEFGAGTDPAQGAALAQAVIDELMEKKASIFAATHFPALKAYALSRPGVRAASVLFDPDTKKPLFRLVYDQVGASQALEVAREHGLPEAVLKRARNYLLLDGEDTGQLMERLNRLALTREREADALKEERLAFKLKHKQLEEHLAKERERLFTEIRNQAQYVLREWKDSRLSARQTLKSLAGIRSGILEKKAEEKDSQFETPDFSRLEPGMDLLYAPWNKPGRVLEVDRRKNRVRLDLSGVSIWVEPGDLAWKAESGKVSSFGAEKFVRLSGASVFSSRLDLRGKRADAALAELDSFIDSAILGGREQLEILHGRGTGALRREIHAYIKRHPQVASFDLADEDQGGDGVTVITLK
ncbi:MAG: Smr/MutS family protein [Deltaproteobacteria bacterium]|jgi:DNA mismatch repair protein MutS2|nr:Smr/MutS family protein [Deltaproteobacteria bacterium]